MIHPDEYRRREAAIMSETDLLTKVRGIATALGWLSYHTHDSRRSEPGFPDLVLVRGRYVLYRELKTAKGKVTPEQAAWLGALADTGADTGVWRPGDLLDGSVRACLDIGPRDTVTNERALVIATFRDKRRRAALLHPTP